MWIKPELGAPSEKGKKKYHNKVYVYQYHFFLSKNLQFLYFDTSRVQAWHKSEKLSYVAYWPHFFQGPMPGAECADSRREATAEIVLILPCMVD